MNNKKPLVSVIVPIFNVESYLTRCISSIINQTYENLQIILVDDGSTDRSVEICDRFKLIDSRVHVIHQSNGGLSSARNIGIDNAKGQYLLFVDSDDYIKEDMIEKLYTSIMDNDSDIALSNVSLVDISGNLIRNFFEKEKIVLYKEEVFNRLIYGGGVHFIVAWNKLYKSEIFDDIRYPIGKLNEDEFILHEILNKCNRISIVNEPLYFYVQRPGSIMNSTVNIKRLDVIEALYKRYLFFKSNKLLDNYPDFGDSVWFYYYSLRKKVKFYNVSQFRRVIVIDHMFRKIYFSTKKRRLLDHAKFLIPDLYFKYEGIKFLLINKLRKK